MQKMFQNTDDQIQSFRAWAKQHKALRMVAYVFIFALLWPVIVAYLLARFASKHIASHSITKALSIAIVGFGILFNGAWVYGMANPQSSEKKSPATQISQEATEQKLEEAQPVNAEPPKPKLYKIVEVIDGDTIKVDYEGKTETVRLIGLNTPETVDPRTTVQCFGLEASKRAKELLTGKSVQLEADESQSNRDKYNRLLRYAVFEDNTNFNKQMIAEGFAYEYTYEVPYKYQQDFKNAQAEASNGSKGLWSPATCNGQKTKPEQPAAVAPKPAAPKPAPAPAPAPTPRPASNCSIKGNISYTSGEKIYHVTGGQYYDRTEINTSSGERYFCSETEAVNAGWRKSQL